ncbi:two-component response regulator [Flavobacterium frigoris PS1]|uniref:Two-component response regulator n=1 Tax=Flavobacterium frigoris (strain PS1) TaxID=1086011 RepID=H7FUE2_FLAFP|nr:two-component response regulator [Flavobacterium frigoris PS1]
MLIDSDKIDVVSTKNAFSTLCIGAMLHFAESENEAWSLLQGDHKISPTPKIILIDINQNGSSGMELLHKIRNHPDLKSILVFVITKTNNEENKVAALNLNIAGYLRKPVENGSNIDFFSRLNDYWNIIEFASEKK